MREHKKIILVLAVITAFFTAVLFMPRPLIAGNLEPPPEAWDYILDAPVPTSPSLSEIYTKTITSINNVTRFPQCQGIRYLDLLDGTVADCITGLIWMKKADCIQDFWAGASIACPLMKDSVCDIKDGSKPGDWRLPTIRELESLADFNFSDPVIPPGIFDNVQSSKYWSRTVDTTPGWDNHIWAYNMENGTLYHAANILDQWYVWCVKGGP